MPPKDISSRMTFLSRDDLWKIEKPYTTDFPVDQIEGAQMTNHKFDIRPITVHDARGSEEKFTLDQNGFCYLKAKTSLQAESASPEMTSQIENYMEEVIEILRKKFPEYQEIKPMDFQIRKRDPAFPSGEERRVEFAQPSPMAHTDFSQRGAFLRMADIFPETPSDYEDRKFELINVWRVLTGPNNDWPLALCDFSLLSDQDITTNDALDYRRIGENSLLHHNDSQRWYYLSDMEEDDLIIFRNSDSEGKMSRGFHAAFQNPNSSGGLRRSIELRIVAFRD